MDILRGCHPLCGPGCRLSEKKAPCCGSSEAGLLCRGKWSAQANQPNPTSIQLDQSFPHPRYAILCRSCVSKGRTDSVASRQATLASLNPFDCLFLLDAAALSLGQIVIVPTQNRLDIFLEILTELSYLFFYTLSCFGFRHSVFTCLSPKNHGRDSSRSVPTNPLPFRQRAMLERPGAFPGLC